MGLFTKPKRYKRLVKHKRKKRTDNSAFSKNTQRLVRENKDGSQVYQSHLSGKYTYLDKKGKVIKTKKK